MNVGRLTDAENLLEELRDKVQGPLDWETRRQVVEALVWGITVDSRGEGRKKEATLTVTYAFEPRVHAVEHGTSSSTGISGPPRRPWVRCWPTTCNTTGCRPTC